MPRDVHGKAIAGPRDKKTGMAHMKMEDSEKKKEIGVPPATKGPDYPYGLRIHLNRDGLKKVGLSDMPEVGHAVHLRAKAAVVGVRSEKREGGEDERHLEMQITHLGISHKADGFEDEDQGGSSKTPEAGHVTKR